MKIMQSFRFTEETFFNTPDKGDYIREIMASKLSETVVNLSDIQVCKIEHNQVKVEMEAYVITPTQFRMVINLLEQIIVLLRREDAEKAKEMRDVIEAIFIGETTFTGGAERDSKSVLKISRDE